MKKVSIIIPVYNAEEYLNKCVDSCLNQTIGDIEVILINDASPDNSYLIMQEYENKNPETVKCIYLEENLRQGGARNRGIRASEGEFLCFVDADDYIAPEMCETLYCEAIKNGSDIACCDGWRLYPNKKNYWRVFTSHDFEENNCLIHFTSQCYALFRRELIVDNKLFFPEHIFHEDTAVVPLWYSLSNKTTHVEKPFYFRTIHEGSTTQSLKIDSTIQMISVLKALLENAKRIGVYEKKKAELDAFIFYRIFGAQKMLGDWNCIITDLNVYEAQLKYWREYPFDTSLFHNLLKGDEFIKTMMFLYMGNKIGNDILDISQKIDDERKNRLRYLVKKFENNNYDLVLWGYGKKGKVFARELSQITDNYEIGDGSLNLQGTMDDMSGKIIRDATWIENNLKKPVFLLLSDYLYKDMELSLREKKKDIITFDALSYLLYGLESLDSTISTGLR